jgi:Rps23 Pro-64 3,4-dihydroxylase Tpa1-like proline 4-hydroxylase
MIQQEFMSAEPFPHLVLDDFAPTATLAKVAAGFDAVRADAWVRYDDCDERGKSACSDLAAMPEACREFIATLSGTTAARLCQWLTGIDDLSPDESLYGGGLHRTERGGFLGVHLDNERHPLTGLARRLNLIVYCTDWSAAGGWRDEWGGHLELWDRACSRPVKRIAPLWNRAVLFETSAHSFHGHSQPLACPPDFCRKSVAVYFWSPLRARARFVARADDPHDPALEFARLERSRSRVTVEGSNGDRR